MNRKINIAAQKPEVVNQLAGIDQYLKKNSEIDQRLIELINVYVSQINGCAYCLNVHLNNAKKLGITDKKLSLVIVWKETQIFSEEERIALELAHKVTNISYSSISDSDYIKFSEFFSESAYIDLLLTITTINTWNRLMLGTGATITN